MNKGHTIILTLTLTLFAASAAWGQDNSGQQSGGATPDSNPQQPVPAFGQENPAPPNDENPPISGLDVPNLEPHAAPLSYLQAGAHVSESVDSNIENALGGSNLNTITRALGSLQLERLWSNYDLALDYLGGVGYYNVSNIGFEQIEEMGLDQKVTWKRGQLGIRDSFSYQPEGTFGGSYGSVGTTGAALGGQSAFFGGIGLGDLSQVPRIMNLTLLDVVENLTPRSSVTLTGGYGFIHFLENNPSTGNSFIGNTQISGQAGYDVLLGPRDQGALVYGYQEFRFSAGISFYSQVIQLMWGHRISGRMDFLIGAGPQFTQINHLLTPVSAPTSADTIPPCVLGAGLSLECPTNDLRVSAAGRASLRYRFPEVSLDLSYDHYITSGSGFFAGAESDVATLHASRPLGRVWGVYSDLGYTRDSRVLPLTCPLGSSAISCPGVSADTYQYGFAGLGVHRMLGRHFHVFASYQFNDLDFDNSYCQTTPGPCSRISTRHVGTIGLDWTPRPIRLD
ncbi:MAG: hypothetical protein WAM69_03695 [Candidatus Sulfotelmatobacter sp.]